MAISKQCVAQTESQGQYQKWKDLADSVIERKARHDILPYLVGTKIEI